MLLGELIMTGTPKIWIGNAARMLIRLMLLSSVF